MSEKITYNISPETLDSFGETAKIFDPVLERGLDIHVPEAKEEIAELPDGRIAVTYVFPMYNEGEAKAGDPGRIELRDTYIYDRNQRHHLGFQRDYKWNGRGKNHDQWRQRLDNYRSAPLPSERDIAECAASVETSYSRPFRDKDVDILAKYQDGLFNELVKALPAGLELSVPDPRSNYALLDLGKVGEDQELILTFAVVDSTGKKPGSVLVRYRLFYTGTNGANTRAAYHYEREIVPGPGSENDAGWQAIANRLSKVQEPDLETYQALANDFVQKSDILFAPPDFPSVEPESNPPPGGFPKFSKELLEEHMASLIRVERALPLTDFDQAFYDGLSKSKDYFAPLRAALGESFSLNLNDPPLEISPQFENGKTSIWFKYSLRPDLPGSNPDPEQNGDGAYIEYTERWTFDGGKLKIARSAKAYGAEDGDVVDRAAKAINDSIEQKKFPAEGDKATLEMAGVVLPYVVPNIYYEFLPRRLEVSPEMSFEQQLGLAALEQTQSFLTPFLFQTGVDPSFRNRMFRLFGGVLHSSDEEEMRETEIGQLQKLEKIAIDELKKAKDGKNATAMIRELQKIESAAIDGFKKVEDGENIAAVLQGLQEAENAAIDKLKQAKDGKGVAVAVQGLEAAENAAIDALENAKRGNNTALQELLGSEIAAIQELQAAEKKATVEVTQMEVPAAKDFKLAEVRRQREEIQRHEDRLLATQLVTMISVGRLWQARDLANGFHSPTFKQAFQDALAVSLAQIQSREGLTIMSQVAMDQIHLRVAASSAWRHHGPKVDKDIEEETLFGPATKDKTKDNKLPRGLFGKAFLQVSISKSANPLTVLRDLCDRTKAKEIKDQEAKDKKAKGSEADKAKKTANPNEDPSEEVDKLLLLTPAEQAMAERILDEKNGIMHQLASIAQQPNPDDRANAYSKLARGELFEAKLMTSAKWLAQFVMEKLPKSRTEESLQIFHQLAVEQIASRLKVQQWQKDQENSKTTKATRSLLEKLQSKIEEDPKKAFFERLEALDELSGGDKLNEAEKQIRKLWRENPILIKMISDASAASDLKQRIEIYKKQFEALKLPDASKLALDNTLAAFEQPRARVAVAAENLQALGFFMQQFQLLSQQLDDAAAKAQDATIASLSKKIDSRVKALKAELKQIPNAPTFDTYFRSKFKSAFDLLNFLEDSDLTDKEKKLRKQILGNDVLRQVSAIAAEPKMEARIQAYQGLLDKLFSSSELSQIENKDEIQKSLKDELSDLNSEETSKSPGAEALDLLNVFLGAQHVAEVTKVAEEFQAQKNIVDGLLGKAASVAAQFPNETASVVLWRLNDAVLSDDEKKVRNTLLSDFNLRTFSEIAAEPNIEKRGNAYVKLLTEGVMQKAGFMQTANWLRSMLTLGKIPDEKGYFREPLENQATMQKMASGKANPWAEVANLQKLDADVRGFLAFTEGEGGLGNNLGYGLPNFFEGFSAPATLIPMALMPLGGMAAKAAFVSRFGGFVGGSMELLGEAATLTYGSRILNSTWYASEGQWDNNNDLKTNLALMAAGRLAGIGKAIFKERYMAPGKLGFKWAGGYVAGEAPEALLVDTPLGKIETIRPASGPGVAQLTAAGERFSSLLDHVTGLGAMYGANWVSHKLGWNPEKSGLVATAMFYLQGHGTSQLASPLTLGLTGRMRGFMAGLDLRRTYSKMPEITFQNKKGKKYQFYLPNDGDEMFLDGALLDNPKGKEIQIRRKDGKLELFDERKQDQANNRLPVYRKAHNGNNFEKVPLSEWIELAEGDVVALGTEEFHVKLPKIIRTAAQVPPAGSVPLRLFTGAQHLPAVVLTDAASGARFEWTPKPEPGANAKVETSLDEFLLGHKDNKIQVIQNADGGFVLLDGRQVPQSPAAANPGGQPQPGSLAQGTGRSGPPPIPGGQPQPGGLAQLAQGTVSMPPPPIPGGQPQPGGLAQGTGRGGPPPIPDTTQPKLYLNNQEVKPGVPTPIMDGAVLRDHPVGPGASTPITGGNAPPEPGREIRIALPQADPLIRALADAPRADQHSLARVIAQAKAKKDSKVLFKPSSLSGANEVMQLVAEVFAGKRPLRTLPTELNLQAGVEALLEAQVADLEKAGFEEKPDYALRPKLLDARMTPLEIKFHTLKAMEALRDGVAGARSLPELLLLLGHTPFVNLGTIDGETEIFNQLDTKTLKVLRGQVERDIKEADESIKVVTKAIKETEPKLNAFMKTLPMVAAALEVVSALDAIRTDFFSIDGIMDTIDAFSNLKETLSEFDETSSPAEIVARLGTRLKDLARQRMANDRSLEKIDADLKRRGQNPTAAGQAEGALHDAQLIERLPGDFGIRQRARDLRENSAGQTLNIKEGKLLHKIIGRLKYPGAPAEQDFDAERIILRRVLDSAGPQARRLLGSATTSAELKLILDVYFGPSAHSRELPGKEGFQLIALLGGVKLEGPAVGLGISTENPTGPVKIVRGDLDAFARANKGDALVVRTHPVDGAGRQLGFSNDELSALAQQALNLWPSRGKFGDGIQFKGQNSGTQFFFDPGTNSFVTWDFLGPQGIAEIRIKMVDEVTMKGTVVKIEGIEINYGVKSKVSLSVPFQVEVDSATVIPVKSTKDVNYKTQLEKFPVGVKPITTSRILRAPGLVAGALTFLGEQVPRPFKALVESVKGALRKKPSDAKEATPKADEPPAENAPSPPPSSALTLPPNSKIVPNQVGGIARVSPAPDGSQIFMVAAGVDGHQGGGQEAALLALEGVLSSFSASGNDMAKAIGFADRVVQGLHDEAVGQKQPGTGLAALKVNPPNMPGGPHSIEFYSTGNSKGVLFRRDQITGKWCVFYRTKVGESDNILGRNMTVHGTAAGELSNKTGYYPIPGWWNIELKEGDLAVIASAAPGEESIPDAMVLETWLQDAKTEADVGRIFQEKITERAEIRNKADKTFAQPGSSPIGGRMRIERGAALFIDSKGDVWNKIGGGEKVDHYGTGNFNATTYLHPGKPDAAPGGSTPPPASPSPPKTGPSGPSAAPGGSTPLPSAGASGSKPEAPAKQTGPGLTPPPIPKGAVDPRAATELFSPQGSGPSNPSLPPAGSQPPPPPRRRSGPSATIPPAPGTAPGSTVPPGGSGPGDLGAPPPTPPARPTPPPPPGSPVTGQRAAIRSATLSAPPPTPPARPTPPPPPQPMTEKFLAHHLNLLNALERQSLTLGWSSNSVNQLLSPGANGEFIYKRATLTMSPEGKFIGAVLRSPGGEEYHPQGHQEGSKIDIVFQGTTVVWHGPVATLNPAQQVEIEALVKHGDNARTQLQSNPRHALAAKLLELGELGGMAKNIIRSVFEDYGKTQKTRAGSSKIMLNIISENGLLRAVSDEDTRGKVLGRIVFSVHKEKTTKVIGEFEVIPMEGQEENTQKINELLEFLEKSLEEQSISNSGASGPGVPPPPGRSTTGGSAQGQTPPPPGSPPKKGPGQIATVPSTAEVPPEARPESTAAMPVAPFTASNYIALFTGVDSQELRIGTVTLFDNGKIQRIDVNPVDFKRPWEEQFKEMQDENKVSIVLYKGAVVKVGETAHLNFQQEAEISALEARGIDVRDARGTKETLAFMGNKQWYGLAADINSLLVSAAAEGKSSLSMDMVESKGKDSKGKLRAFNTLANYTGEFRWRFQFTLPETQQGHDGQDTFLNYRITRTNANMPDNAKSQLERVEQILDFLKQQHQRKT